VRNRGQNYFVLINITHNTNPEVAAQMSMKNFCQYAPFTVEVLYGNAFAHRTRDPIILTIYRPNFQ
jgi:hypothetical protein